MAETLRIDKWLWFARFFKTRSLAQSVIAAGEVRLNGQPVGKAAQSVCPGDELLFPTGRRWRRVRVAALGARRGPAVEAQGLYEELEPPAIADED
ncbi:MAG: RNA-binding S4 domain-containing protein [Magnetospirillum sp.]|nr:RNA-binding S4 domain-containing protein [Magnetospirillum sp.]